MEELAVDMDMDTPQGFKNMDAIHHSNLISNMDSFSQAYVEAALFSSTDNFTYNHGEKKSEFDPEYDEDEPSGIEDIGGEPLDKKYTINDIDPNTLRKMIADCNSFYDKYSELYHRAGWADDRAAHDFWLTRNGHGAGFWSRELNELDPELYGNITDEQFEDVKELLTKAAKSYGTYDLYLGDGEYDGVIFGG
jgi:hypothetical protein